MVTNSYIDTLTHTHTTVAIAIAQWEWALCWAHLMKLNVSNICKQ